MTTSDDFEQRIAERLEKAQSDRRAKEEADRRAKIEEAERQANVAEAEEDWFPIAKRIRDSDFAEALETARRHLKGGQIRNEDRHRGYWSHLITDDARISVAIIPVPNRDLIMLRAIAECRLDRIPTLIHDETIEFSPANFSGDEPRLWIEGQIIDMAAKLIEHTIS
jgi:hypothetical protein